ncbi:zinc finger protein datilografo isoform X4 [Osmia lignaria lignaria]|uniref:zinc finger protein datilografo isoform X4 n=1 Tax=Osmia lignaria lignaria TaxID=1437193 RepID=UPI0014789D47|nr:zinc finger protein 628-like isoform X3 [Osmia lignaria]
MEVQSSAVTAAANLHVLRQHVFKMSDYWQQPQRGPPQHSPGIQHSPISNSTQQQQHQQQVQQMHSPLGQQQQQQQQQHQQQQTNVSQVQQTGNSGLGQTASPQQQMQQQQHAMSMNQQTAQGGQHQSSPAPTTPSPQADHQGAIASSMAQSLHSLAQAQQTMSQASSPSLAVQAVQAAQAAQALNQNLGQALTQALTQNMQQNLGQTLQHNLAQNLTPSLSPQQQQQLLNQPQNLSQTSQNLQQNIQSQAQNLSQTLQQQAQNLTQNLGQSLSQQALQQQAAQNLTQNLQQQAQNLTQNLQQQALNMSGSIAQNGALAGMKMSNQQQNSQNSMLSPGATSQDSHDISLTEKLVNELQSRASAAGLGGAGGAGGGAGMGNLTFEECWSVVQGILMHKSAMQMHARELGAAGALTARAGGGMAGGLAALAPIGVGPGGMIAGNEVKPHQCQQCLKSFSSNHQLVQHIRVHTGEKPYKCSYCDRRFKQLSHVQQHTRLHTGERPYKCHLPDCGRAFIQLSNLQQHLRNHDAQVERAKNRPFHCNICGKGFATESSLRTHTSKVSHCSKYPWQRLKELQQRVVFQQHAALIGGPNATSCPVCHKLFLGGEALMEHMKHTHKDPNASGVAIPSADCTTSVVGVYIAKRRTANHPCPVCGKHYVNEGSLRKHLACHPETSQLSTSLRMWPCSVCQAVFTHESGLLSHMEHMRMDPKHQFAAQYVLSRAAAERREREILASSSLGAGLGVLGSQSGGPQNLQQPPMCPSPSAHSDSSSGNGRLSSAGSEPDFCVGTGLLNNNNNNNNNNMASPGPSSNKLSDMLRAGSQPTSAQQYHDEMQSQQQRMAVMAAAVSAGLQNSVSPNLSPVDMASLAAAMRMGNNGDMSGGAQGSTGPQQQGVQATGPEQTLRMHQAEALLRSQAEAALRLAVSQAAAAAASSAVGGDVRHHLGQHNGGNTSGMPGHHTNQQMSQQDTLPPDLGEALRLQEQRLEQALRLHGDPRALSFTIQQVVNQQNSQQP